MNDTQRLEAMDSYFVRYRKTLNKLKQNEQDSKDLREKYEQNRLDLSNERTRISRELSNMRQVITKMIDEGCDPVMAGLVMNEDDATSNTIWQTRDEETVGMAMNSNGFANRIAKTADISNLSIGQLSWPGATGAIGAAGSISMGHNGGYQQGYGAVPPQHTHPGVTADMKGFVDGQGNYHEYAWTGTAET